VPLQKLPVSSKNIYAEEPAVFSGNISYGCPTGLYFPTIRMQADWDFFPNKKSLPARASFETSVNFNARAEKVMTTPSFSDAILSGRRCLVPADGFYEWKNLGTIKQPYCFEVGSGDVFAFAGLWDQWKNPNGETIKSCAIDSLVTGTWKK